MSNVTETEIINQIRELLLLQEKDVMTSAKRQARTKIIDWLLCPKILGIKTVN
jgi:hypothetical protein